MIAAVETATERLAVRPALSLIAIEQVPAPSGVTANCAVPPPFETAFTLAIVPVSGAHVSLSVNEPEYPLSLTLNDCAAFDENASVLTDVVGGGGVGVAVGTVVGDVLGVTLVVGSDAVPPPPPPHAASVRSNAAAHARAMRGRSIIVLT